MAPSPSSPEDEEASSASDRDDALDEDLEALRRACMITGRRPGDLDGAGSGGESSDSEDDLDILRGLQERFSVQPSSGGADPPITRPLSLTLPSESDEDDFETLRAIQRRFVQYQNDSVKMQYEWCSHEAALNATNTASGQETSSFLLANGTGMSVHQEYNVSIVNKSLNSISGVNLENTQDISIELHQNEDRTCHLSSSVPVSSRFPKCAQAFVDALKRNRSCQKFIRTKLIEIEAKIERNKALKERVKCLMNFQVASRRRTTQFLSQKKDPRVRLISLPKRRISNTSKASIRKSLQCGPSENSHVSKYRMVLSRFPVSLYKQPWSKSEKENLSKGIKQQYQERVLLNTMELASNLEGTVGDSAVILSNNFEFLPEDIRSFLPMVNWERLASMYLTGRSGVECEAWWLNIEDPLINHNPWTSLEEKKLLHIVQNRGIYNWIDIAILLGTHRTPFQCLVHYQRSLNPCILKKDWTEDEDARLRAAVEDFGDNWQLVASHMEGRTGPQCSNRWRKCLIGRKVGRWSVDEDKRLKVSVMLFSAKNWNKIAQFISGRTQVQCRERWINCLDPSLNLKAWTEEEDAKLTEAIAAHGYCWSKVASFVPPRTDNQCWRRWKVLFRDEVPLRRAAWKMQKAVLITNFVDRESERPSIGPNDFCQVLGIHTLTDAQVNDGRRKEKKRGRPKSKNQVDLAHSTISKPVCSRKCKAKVKNFKEHAVTDSRPDCSREYKAKVESSEENAIIGNQPVCSRKCKDKVENFKENATIANWLEVIRHKIMSKKRKKRSSKQHKELVQHSRSKGNHEFAVPVECLPRSDDVSQRDAAARKSDMASSSVGAVRQSYLRRSKAKAKSFLEKLIRNGMEEPSVHKTNLGKRKGKRSVNITSDDGSSQSARDHRHLESSTTCMETRGTFESELDDVYQLDGVVLNGPGNTSSEVHHPKFSRRSTGMSTLEETSTQGRQARLTEDTRKRKGNKRLRKLLPGDRCDQPNDETVVMGLIGGVLDETCRMGMLNVPQSNLGQTVRITEEDHPPKAVNNEPKNELGLQDVVQEAANNSERIKLPTMITKA